MRETARRLGRRPDSGLHEEEGVGSWHLLRASDKDMTGTRFAFFFF